MILLTAGVYKPKQVTGYLKYIFFFFFFSFKNGSSIICNFRYGRAIGCSLVDRSFTKFKLRRQLYRVLQVGCQLQSENTELSADL